MQRQRGMFWYYVAARGFAQGLLFFSAYACRRAAGSLFVVELSEAQSHHLPVAPLLVFRKVIHVHRAGLGPDIVPAYHRNPQAVIKLHHAYGRVGLEMRPPFVWPIDLPVWVLVGLPVFEFSISLFLG